MGLSFTSIPDRTGPAVYFIGNGSSLIESQLIALANKIDMSLRQKVQLEYFDSTRGDGLRVKEFYALSIFPTVLIVMDDDTIVQQWDHTLPRADEVTYALSHIAGSLRSS